MRRVKDVLKRMERILGCKVRAVERTGTPLARQFSLTRLWEGIKGGREDCVPCQQDGEQLYPCMKRNVSYMNVCLKCNQFVTMILSTIYLSLLILLLILMILWRPWWSKLLVWMRILVTWSILINYTA